MFIEIQETDDDVYTINDMDIVFEQDTQFICNDEGMFFINKLSDFKEHNNKFYLTDEENVLTIEREHYDIIKELFEEKGRSL